VVKRGGGKEGNFDAMRLRVWITVLSVAALFVVLLEGCHASCEPMDVHGLNAQCGGGSGATGYMWTGSSCIFTRACNCTGSDCQRLYNTQDACETAHIHCTAR
jgi:hypothetical protein